MAAAGVGGGISGAYPEEMIESEHPESQGAEDGLTAKQHESDSKRESRELAERSEARRAKREARAIEARAWQQRHDSPGSRSRPVRPILLGVAILAAALLVVAVLKSTSAPPVEVEQNQVEQDSPATTDDAIEPDPVTGAPIPAAGTQAREDMERAEIACFDTGRTDCADYPGAYLDDPNAYPPAP